MRDARLPMLVIFFAVLLNLLGCTHREGSEMSGCAIQAERLEKEGRWAEAAELRRSAALQSGPETWDQHIRRALADYLMADRLEAAERFAAECLERSPQSHQVLFYLGDSQRVMMQYEPARATLEKLLQREPGHPKGTFALGHVLLRLGKPAEALPLLERFLESTGGPEDLRTLGEIECARALRRLGRPAESADRIAKVLEADPYNTVALSEAAQIFSFLGKADLAKGLREEHAWLFQLGHQLSSEDESKVFPTGEASEGARLREALQAADRREFLGATRKLEELLAQNAADAALAGPLIRLWLRLFRFHDALRVAATSLSKGGVESPDLLSAQADANHALGRLDAERSVLRRASALLEANSLGGPPDRGLALETHSRAGLLELEPGGSLEEADRCFARAAAVAPGDWRPAFGIGRTLMEKGNVTKALEHFDEALKLVGEDPAGTMELLRWRAVLKGLSGDLTAAAREIMKLVKENPGNLENFKAFERVFGSKQSEPEVTRVLELKRGLEEKISARDAAVRSVAEASFGESGPNYLGLGKRFLAEGSRERALDCLFLAAELEPSSTESLRLLASALTGPRETFLRLRTLRRILERAPADTDALEALARSYLGLGLRLDEAESLAARLQTLKPGEAGAKLLVEIREQKTRG